MINKIEFKQGFLIRVETWENDGDNYQTADYQCATVDEVELIVAACNMFKSCNDYENPGFGNSGGDIEYHEYFEEMGLTDDQTETVLNTLVGAWCDGEYFRVVESVKIFCIPQSVSFPEITLV